MRLVKLSDMVFDLDHVKMILGSEEPTIYMTDGEEFETTDDLEKVWSAIQLARGAWDRDRRRPPPTPAPSDPSQR